MELEEIDFGYACISSIIEDCSPAKTVQLGRYRDLEDDESKIFRVERVSRKNLENTIRLLWHNISEDIKLYRFTSQLIPLANHPEGQIWDFREVLSDQLSKIGRIVKKHSLKVSTHPGQYTVINTKYDEKFKNAVRDLVYHDRVLSAMGLDERAIMVTHVGGVYNDKEGSMERFISNFKKLPESVQNRLVIENDDTSYTIKDVLEICQTLDRPMVLDVHHHQYNNQGEELTEYLPDIFATWEDIDRPPKVHFSGPRSEKHPLRHADYIDVDDFLDFYEKARDYKFDVMLEAKRQDKALMKLREELGI